MCWNVLDAVTVSGWLVIWTGVSCNYFLIFLTAKRMLPGIFIARAPSGQKLEFIAAAGIPVQIFVRLYCLCNRF